MRKSRAGESGGGRGDRLQRLIDELVTESEAALRFKNAGHLRQLALTIRTLSTVSQRIDLQPIPNEFCEYCNGPSNLSDDDAALLEAFLQRQRDKELRDRQQPADEKA